jgi:hypothetical protein
VPYSFFPLKGQIGALQLLGIKEARSSFEKLATSEQEWHPAAPRFLKIKSGAALRRDSSRRHQQVRTRQKQSLY